jgi:hypothetical protein
MTTVVPLTVERAVPTDQASSSSVVSIRITSLHEEFGLRLGQRDVAHIQFLADAYDQLPPILVHWPGMGIIDGVHRVLAARLLGRSEVAARFFTGSGSEAFLLAVRANVLQGKPLNGREREEAARRILADYPNWSDRRIAQVCSLSPKTVVEVRRRSTGENPQLNGRLGRDGRVRPVDPVGVRMTIVEIVTQNPRASLRWIARRAGASQATVLDVRRRLERGEDPVPSKFRQGSMGSTDTNREPMTDQRATPIWAADSACSSTSETRAFAHWFDATSVSEADAEQYAVAVPLNRVFPVADEARRRATFWVGFASLLEERPRRPRAGAVGAS